MSSNLTSLSKEVTDLAGQAGKLSAEIHSLSGKIDSTIASHIKTTVTTGIDPFIFAITIFVLACFVGYYVVWKVTPALHTPLMSVTNAISGIIVVGAIIALGPKGFGFSQFVGFIAVIIAAINIFGGFIVTYRMLEMFRKK